MKILQICNKPPFPAVDGGCIAINAITRGLVNTGIAVKVLAITTPKHQLKNENIPQDYLEETEFEHVFVNTNVNFFKAVSSFLQNRSYHIDRFISKEFNNKLIDQLKKDKFDIIQLESIFVAPYITTIRQYSDSKIIIRAHNIEHQIWNRIVLNQKNIFKRFVLRKMIKPFKKFELSVFNKIDAYFPISEVDYSYFHEFFPNILGKVIPMGIDLERYECEKLYIPSSPPKLCFIGNMNWIPNREGVDWFLNEIWQNTVEKFPALTLKIAGRGTKDVYAHVKHENVYIEGDVDDVNKFIAYHDIMIVPLLSGSGVRIKILEGMALGKTIITTTIGAEGLNVENGNNIFIADTSSDFIDVIEKCINTPELCRIIGKNAREYITLNHNNEIITKQLIETYNEIIG